MGFVRSLTIGDAGDPFNGSLDIKFSGKQSMGILEFTVRGIYAGYEVVPPNPWAIVLILAEYGKNHPLASSFLTAKELANSLAKRYGVYSTDPLEVVRTVYRLRTSLSKLVIAEKLASNGFLPRASDFGKVLIHHNNSLGYRFNLPAKHITIDLQGV